MNIEQVLDKIGLIPGPFRDECRDFILSWCADALVHMGGREPDEIEAMLLRAAFREAMNTWLDKKSNLRLKDGG